MRYEYIVKLEPELSICNEYGDLIGGIHYKILNSSMVNKDILWSRWDEKGSLLSIEFEKELSYEDKIILDNIIGDI